MRRGPTSIYLSKRNCYNKGVEPEGWPGAHLPGTWSATRCHSQTINKWGGIACDISKMDSKKQKGVGGRDEYKCEEQLN